MGGGGAFCALQTHNSNAPLAPRHNGCLTDISISGLRSHTAVKMKMKRRDVAPAGGDTQMPAILLSTAFINFRGGPPGAGKTITRLIRFSAPSSKLCKKKKPSQTKQTHQFVYFQINTRAASQSSGPPFSSLALFPPR